MSSSSTSPSGITIAVFNEELWAKFYPRTEMIVRGGNGRRTFPVLKYTVKGLDPIAMYTVHLHMERIGDHKLRWEKEWIETDVTSPRLPIQKLKHRALELFGNQWMKFHISFDYIRLNNNKDTVKDANVDILMQSMHKWIPVVTIRNEENGKEEEFRLEITQFYTVTAYQDFSIRDLKVELNDHASGFREESTRQKKKRALAPPPAENLKSSESEGIEDQKTLDSEDPNIPTKAHKQAETAPLRPLVQNHNLQAQNHSMAFQHMNFYLFLFCAMNAMYSNTLNSTGNIGNQSPGLPLRLPTPNVMDSNRPGNSNQSSQEVQRNSVNSEVEENRKDS